MPHKVNYLWRGGTGGARSSVDMLPRRRRVLRASGFVLSITRVPLRLDPPLLLLAVSFAAWFFRLMRDL